MYDVGAIIEWVVVSIAKPAGHRRRFLIVDAQEDMLGLYDYTTRNCTVMYLSFARANTKIIYNSHLK